jgi:hypothetical protein
VAYDVITIIIIISDACNYLSCIPQTDIFNLIPILTYIIAIISKPLYYTAYNDPIGGHLGFRAFPVTLSEGSTTKINQICPRKLYAKCGAFIRKCTVFMKNDAKGPDYN